MTYYLTALLIQYIIIQTAPRAVIPKQRSASCDLSTVPDSPLDGATVYVNRLSCSERNIANKTGHSQKKHKIQSGSTETDTLKIYGIYIFHGKSNLE